MCWKIFFRVGLSDGVKKQVRLMLGSFCREIVFEEGKLLSGSDDPP